MVCQCCGKPKNSIGPQKSSLMKGNTFLACDTCRDSKFEPRPYIIIVGRSKGIAAVREFINKRLYVGPEITAIEIIP